MFTIIFITLVVLLFGGISIYIALSAPAFLMIWLKGVPFVVFIQQMISGIDKFALMAVPFFILAANIMGKGGMSKRILLIANLLVGKYYGGTAITTVLACMFFGALSGSSPATVIAIGALTFPALIEAGYGRKFSLGLIMSASALAIIIPPSITMIVYGSVTGTSVGALFLGGIGPGILLGLLLMIYSVLYARKHNIRETTSRPWSEVKGEVLQSLWALGVPVIILGGIYGGVFTPTESATVSCIYAIIVGMFVYRELSFRDVLHTCVDSAVTTAQIMIIISAAAVLSWTFTIGQLPVLIDQLMTNIPLTYTVVTLILIFIMVIAGMFMDASAYILLFASLFLPVTASVGMNPVFLGILMTICGGLGMFSPPFGLNIFVSISAFKAPFNELARATVPFLVIFLIGILLIAFVPDITMYLPTRAYGTNFM
ncbi:MAG: TRAP transporter large permease [Syntrophomonas sp.]